MGLPIIGQRHPDRDHDWDHASASQVKLFLESEGGCERRWFHEKVHGHKSPETEALARGKAIHAYLERWARDGEEVPDDKGLGTIARKALPIVLPIRSRITSVERKLDDIFEVAGVKWAGYVDLELGGPLEIWDYKTTSDKDANGKYAKKPADLIKDPQMLAYALERMLATGEERIPVRHIYIPTKHKTAEAWPVDAVITPEILDTHWPKVEAAVTRMAEIARGGDLYAAKQNPSACWAYNKPCPFRSHCFGSNPSSKTESETLSMSATLEAIRARKAQLAAQNGTAPTATPTNVAPPQAAAKAPTGATPAATPAAPVQAPQAAPKAANPMLAAIAARKAALAAPQAEPTPPNPSLAPTPDTDGGTYTPVPCAACEEAPALSDSDICAGCTDAAKPNPPDANTGSAHLTAPQAAPVTPITPAAPAPTGERIRRTKAEIAAGLSIEQAAAFRASGMTDPVAWLAEQDTTITSPAVVAAVRAEAAKVAAEPYAEKLAEQIAAVAEAGTAPILAAPTSGGLVLYVDCLPFGRHVRRLEGYLEDLAAAIAAEKDVPDYRLIDFGKGNGYLAALIRQNPPEPGEWAISSYGPTAKTALEVLIPHAGEVIKGC